MSELTLSFLGVPQIHKNGRLLPVAASKALALLAYLALTKHAQRRESLVALFWPDSDTKRGRGTLRYTLSILKKALGDGWLLADRHTIGLNPNTTISIDVHQFQSYLEQGNLSALEQAVTLYRDDFLAGFTLPDSPAFDEWQYFEREALRQQMGQILAHLTRQHQQKNMVTKALDYARRWVAFDPFHEAAHAQLMRLYFNANQRANALRQYKSCVTLLQQELGVSVSNELTALYHKIQTSTPAAETTFLTPPPPLKTAPSLDLPQASTPFIGRTQELADIAQRLQNPDCRLLTLVGPGGIGKTRLAQQAAHNNHHLFPDGLYYIDLVPLEQPHLLVGTIMNALQLSRQGPTTPLEQLTTYLHHRQLCLLLDNFEHLLVGTSVITHLIAHVPQLKIIITSREPLALAIETIYPIQGLPYPAPRLSQEEEIEEQEDSRPISAYESVQLFVQRAHQLNPHFSLKTEEPHVVRICQLVAGMPLGLELAAAWVRIFSCENIVKEIGRNLDFLTSMERHIHERHRSIRAIFESAWQGLPQAAQQLLAQLSLFRGGFTADAILQVTAVSPFTLSVLVNKSLLYRDTHNRYTFHELLRQFAAEKLQSMTALTDPTAKNHAAYYGRFLQTHSPQHAPPIVRQEIQNIRAGWHWAATTPHPIILDTYTHGLYEFYSTVHWYQEGKETFALAVDHLATVPTEAAQLVRAKIQAWLAEFYYERGDSETAVATAKASLQILTKHLSTPEPTTDNSLIVAATFAYKILGVIQFRQGAYEAAKPYLQQSLQLNQASNDKNEHANICLFLGATNYHLGDFEAAKQWLEKSLTLCRAIEQEWGVAHALRWLGTTAHATHNNTLAEKYYRQSLDIFQRLDNQRGMALSSNELGALFQQQGNYQQAKQWYQQALTLYEAVDDKIFMTTILCHLGDICIMMAELEDAEAYLRMAAQIALDLKTAPTLLQVVLGIATLLLQTVKRHLHTQPITSDQYNQIIKIYSLFMIVLEHPSSGTTLSQQARVRCDTLISLLPSDLVAQLPIHTPSLNIDTLTNLMIGSFTH